MMDDVAAKLRRFERNIVLRASAGTGKTEALTRLYNHLRRGETALSEALDGGPVAPISASHIVAVTFTDKAAAEMRLRLSSPEGARIGTLHAFCSTLLRHHAVDAGLDPNFQVLDDTQSSRLLQDAAVHAVLAHLQSNDHEALQLWRDLGGVTHGTDDGLATTLVNLYRNLVEADALQQHLSKARLAGTAPKNLAPNDLAPTHASPSATPQADAETAARRTAVLLRLLHATKAQYDASKEQLDGLDFSDLVLGARDLLRDHPELRRRYVDDIAALLVDEFQDTNAAQRDLIYLLRAKPEVGAWVPTPAELQPRGLFIVGDRKQAIYGFRGADVAVFEQVASDLVAQGGDELSLQSNYRSVAPLLAAIEQLTASAFAAPPQHDFEIAFDTARESLQAARPLPPELDVGTCVEFLAAADDVDAELGEATAVARHIARLARGVAPALVENRDGLWRPAAYGDIALLLPRFTHLRRYTEALETCGVPYQVVQGRGLLQSPEAEDLLSLARVLLGEDDGRCLAAILRSPMVGLKDAELATLARDASFPGWQHGLEADVLHNSAGLANDRQEYLHSVLDLLRRLQALVDRQGLGRTLRLALRRLAELAARAPFADALTTESTCEATRQRVLLEIDDLERRAADPNSTPAAEFSGGAGDPRRTLHRLLHRRQQGDDLALPDAAVDDSGAVRIMTVHQSKGLQFPIVIAADLQRSFQPRSQQIRYDRHPEVGLSVAWRDDDGQWVGIDPAHKEIFQRRERAERLRLFYVQISRARDRLVLVDGGKPGKKRRGILAEVVEPVLGRLEALGLLQRVSAPPVAAPPMVTAPITAAATTAAPTHAVLVATHADSTPGARPPAASREANVIVTTIDAHHASASSLRSLDLPVTELAEFALCPRRYRARYLLRLQDPPHPLRRTDAPRSTPSDPLDAAQVDATAPQRRGTLAHAALEHLDWSETLFAMPTTPFRPDALLETIDRSAAALRRALVAATRQVTSTANDADIEALMPRLLPFVAGPYGRRLAAATSTMRRELPFTLRVNADGDPDDRPAGALWLRGTIDLLAETASADGGTTVDIVDYKLADRRPGDALAPYRFQLQTYALAVRRQLGAANSLRIGVQFLDGSSSEPIFEDFDAAAATRIDTQLQQLAAELLYCSRHGDYSGKPVAYCRQLRCAYLGVCHPS